MSQIGLSYHTEAIAGNGDHATITRSDGLSELHGLVTTSSGGAAVDIAETIIRHYKMLDTGMSFLALTRSGLALSLGVVNDVLLHRWSEKRGLSRLAVTEMIKLLPRLGGYAAQAAGIGGDGVYLVSQAGHLKTILPPVGLDRNNIHSLGLEQRYQPALVSDSFAVNPEDRIVMSTGVLNFADIGDFTDYAEILARRLPPAETAHDLLQLGISGESRAVTVIDCTMMLQLGPAGDCS